MDLKKRTTISFNETFDQFYNWPGYLLDDGTFIEDDTYVEDSFGYNDTYDPDDPDSYDYHDQYYKDHELDYFNKMALVISTTTPLTTFWRIWRTHLRICT